ncbi:MAG: hypothetical protein IJ225_00585 [Solobacterium sp.]|nr:hypothetical protein [Solobacterium sp.]
MCKALDDWSKRERSEGRKEGFKKGVSIGIDKGSTKKEKEMFELMKRAGVTAKQISLISEMLHTPTPTMSHSN